MDSGSTNNQIQNILKEVKLFNHIPQDIIALLAGKVVITNFAAGAPVFIKGETGDCIYIILSGKVKLHEMEMVIAEMGSGDFFGEFSLLDNEPRSLSVSCITECKLAALYRNDFYFVLEKHPETIKNIIEALIKRIKEQNNKIFTHLKNKEKELEEEVNRKTAEIRKNNRELADTLERLRKTQQQLVMKETMASLGQLTAGIAHTLKNPLNFINNFSLLSYDLIRDIKETPTEEEKAELLGNLMLNIEKVYTHGQRANRIVENMLQHNSDGSGEKQSINLNTLTDEILGIAYSAYQASHPGFSCEFNKNFSDDLPNMVLSLKDVSRVLMNVFNNAFYALEEKVKNGSAGLPYQPFIEIITCMENNRILIEIRDNGPGIAASIRDKIFEPFFTTKPSAFSNGLGLSMSNEILKLQNGEILFNPEYSDGASFSIVFKREE